MVYFKSNAAVIFKVQETTAFKTIVATYLQHIGQEPGSVSFQFGSRHVLDTDTPGALGMEDKSCIEASQLKMIVKIKSADNDDEGVCGENPTG